MAFKNVILLLALTCLMAYAAATRNHIDLNMNIDDVKPGYNLAARIAANGSQVIECWKAFVDFKLSCLNATVQYFITHKTDISHCCQTIDVITHKCLPTKLTSIGFTPKESNILINYCAAAPAPSPAA